MKRRTLIKTALAANILPLVPALAQAQAAPGSYPSQPIKILVGITPGASTDYLAREIARGLTERLGVTVRGENKSGANTRWGDGASPTRSSGRPVRSRWSSSTSAPPPPGSG